MRQLSLNYPRGGGVENSTALTVENIKQALLDDPLIAQTLKDGGLTNTEDITLYDIVQAINEAETPRKVAYKEKFIDLVIEKQTGWFVGSEEDGFGDVSERVRSAISKSFSDSILYALDQFRAFGGGYGIDLGYLLADLIRSVIVLSYDLASLYKTLGYKRPEGSRSFNGYSYEHYYSQYFPNIDMEDVDHEILKKV